MKVWQRQFKQFMQYVPRQDGEMRPWQSAGSRPAPGWDSWAATEVSDSQWAVIQVLGVYHDLKFARGTGVWYAIANGDWHTAFPTWGLTRAGPPSDSLS